MNRLLDIITEPDNTIIDMNADIEWVLSNLPKAIRFINHNGKYFTAPELRSIMLEAKKRGYTSIGEITDEIIESATRP
jgi:hypothetical protein